MLNLNFRFSKKEKNVSHFSYGKGLECDTSAAIRIPDTQITVSLKTIAHRKELGLLEEAADSSTGGQDEPEHLAVPGSKEGLKDQWGYISKNTGAILKELT